MYTCETRARDNSNETRVDLAGTPVSSCKQISILLIFVSYKKVCDIRESAR